MWEFCFCDSFFNHLPFIDSQPRHLLVLGWGVLKCDEINKRFNSIGEILKIHSAGTFFDAFVLFI